MTEDDQVTIETDKLYIDSIYNEAVCGPDREAGEIHFDGSGRAEVDPDVADAAAEFWDDVNLPDEAADTVEEQAANVVEDQDA